MTPLLVDVERMRLRALIGTGGIGTGTFFALDGLHTLGREESRSGRFLDNRDYAKLHIIAHYVQTLLGPAFRTFPVGRVGADAPGRRLLEEMAAAGLDLRHVGSVEDAPTMNCVCLLYPDGSGGNLTVRASASETVDPAALRRAEPEFAAFAGRGIALAAPEVPLAARAELLALGTSHGFFRAASFTSRELADSVDPDMLGRIDLLAINRDEASALSGLSPQADLEELAARALERLGPIQPRLSMLVTAGLDGSWSWDGAAAERLPALRADVASSAGAGDAFLAGALAGVAAGLSLSDAHHLARLTGAFSVTSPHTIHPGLDRVSLADFARRQETPLPHSIRLLLGMDS